METITKNKIARAISEKIGFSELLCEKIVSDIFEIASDILMENSLTIRNFGKFSIKHKKSRPVRDINKNLSMKIDERRVISFKSSRSIKISLNK